VDNWQQQKEETSPGEFDAQSLKEALSGFWRDRDLASFCGLVLEHLNPRINAYLKRRFRVDNEDCEDCVAIAIEALISRPDHWEVVRDPQSYLYASAINAARDLLRERKRQHDLVRDLGGADEYQDHTLEETQLEADDNFEATGPLPLPNALHSSQLDALRNSTFAGNPSISEEWANIVVGELFDEYEPASWATEIVSAAIAKLPPSLRVVVEHLAQQPLDFRTGDFDYQSRNAQSDLGISAGTFRTRKTRAYAKLKILIPKTISALGIRPPPRMLPEIFSDQDKTSGTNLGDS
jgi:RNA polymerase sigma factor (sigma-70 family)